MKTVASTAAIAALVLSFTAMAAPVNINTASAEQIAEALNGIGLSKAQAIVEYRETYGLFDRADEIVFVRGIGDATFERNKEDILIK